MQNMNVNQCVAPGEDADKQCKYCPLVVPVHSWVLRGAGSHLGQQRDSNLLWPQFKDIKTKGWSMMEALFN